MLLCIIMLIVIIGINLLSFKLKDADISLFKFLLDKLRPLQKIPAKKPHYIFLEIKEHYNLMYWRSDPNRLYGKIGVFTIDFAYAEKQMLFSGTIEAPPSTTPHELWSIKYSGGSRKLMIPGSGMDTGDPEVDLSIIIEGLNDAAMLAFLNWETRIMLKQIKKYTSRFTLTSLRTDFSIPTFADTTTTSGIINLIDAIIGLTKRMEKKDDIMLGLAHNINKDNTPGVRLRSLQVLEKTFKDNPALLKVFKKALFDPDKRIASFALNQLGEEGIACLYAELKRFNQPRRYIPIIGISTAVELLLEKEGEKCLRDVINCFHNLSFMKERKQIIKVISRSGGEKGEDFLISLLPGRDSNILEEVIVCLAERGTPAAVEPLEHIVNTTKVPVYFREAAKEAIRRIQERIGVREKGMLSMSETEAGEGTLSLSETGGDGGGLSIAGGDEEEEG
jgi:hypothetical protein